MFPSQARVAIAAFKVSATLGGSSAFSFLLSQQMAQLFQLQANVTALQAELQRRKALLSE